MEQLFAALLAGNDEKVSGYNNAHRDHKAHLVVPDRLDPGPLGGARKGAF